MRNNRGGRMRRVLATTARIGRPQASMIVAIVALVFAATGGAIASTQGHPAKLRHGPRASDPRSEEHTSELQSQSNLVCRLLLEKKTQLRDFGFAEHVHRWLLEAGSVAGLDRVATG